jgi:hypothetical protein
VRQVKLTGFGTFSPAYGLYKFSVFGELNNAGIPITIGNEEVAVRCNENVGRTIKSVLGIVVARNPLAADGH